MKKLSVKYLVIVILVVSSLLLGIGCATTTAQNTDNTSSPTIESIVPDENNIVVVYPSAESSVLPSIADVVALVKPSVVAINTEMTITDFFGRTGTQEAAGSGWIISTDGYIVTNNHVIEEAESITVVLDDGRSFDAKVVGTDPLTDIAVVKIDADNLPVVTVGDSAKMRIGDWVVAIGNSLGQGVRATQGIISQQNVYLDVDSGERLYNLIETDAAINPGNSGGPLVNMAGEVIGITNAKLASVEIESVGYAVSTETAVDVIQDLINLGHPVHPWLGVSIYPYELNETVIQQFSLKTNEGALLMEVVAGSPAENAGLQPYDIITSYNGKVITTADDLIEGIRLAKVGQTVEIVYQRGDAKSTTHATLIERK